MGGEVNALKDNEGREGGRGGEEVAGTEGKVMKERFGCNRAHAPGPAGGIIAACVKGPVEVHPMVVLTFSFFNYHYIFRIIQKG